MNQYDASSLALGWLILVQVCGVLSAIGTRLFQGTLLLAWCNRCYLASVLLVGMATLLTANLPPRFWACSGGTLCLMLILATFDEGTGS